MIAQSEQLFNRKIVANINFILKSWYGYEKFSFSPFSVKNKKDNLVTLYSIR